ncbi:MAG: LysM peptidoglycan-binding domain-containing protein [Clostridia bacterium]|nr:LysM peptidoglycan-binding domain-containing protein [Clostridia bacterium]
MKIKNIKKFVRSIFIILGLMLLIVLLIGKTSYSNKEVEYKKICVSEGETLWSIAKANQINNNYYKGKDIRYIVNDLIKINDLKNSNINVNQELIIPEI